MPKMLKLWSFQTLGFYEYLLKHKQITVSQKYIDPYFKDAYDWMVEKMNSRLGTTYKEIYPIWAWYKYYGIRRKPKITETNILPEGTFGVRLLIVKPADQVVLSDFDLWHFVLNGWFINTGSDEDNETETQIDEDGFIFDKLPQQLKQKVINSWDLIFELDLKIKDYTLPKYKKPVQATFWKLRLEEVKEVKFFVAR